MRYRACKPIKPPHNNGIELSLGGVNHQAIEFWPGVFRA
jgi:hypothetical protein